MTTFHINIDMAAKCPRCGKKETVNGGPCLKCLLKAVENGELDKLIKKHKRGVNP